MSVYMTEEEQLEAIKKWWNRHSNVITIVMSIVLILVCGWKYWTWHENQIDTQASATYERLMFAVSNQDSKAAQSFANDLTRDYGKTIYAEVALLGLAKISATEENYDAALVNLLKVANGSKIAALRQVARLRMGRIYKTQKAYDKALDVLATVDDAAYIALVNELKGDVFAAKGQYQEAMTAYKEAMTEVRSKGMGNPFLEMKTNDLAAISRSDTVNNTNEQAA